MHHQLLKMNFSQRKTVLVVYAINILFSIAAIIYTIKNAKLGIIIYITLFVLVVWFILHTSIISDKIEEKTKSLEKKLTKKKSKK
jgi:UDP-GlcNAc:undecaprenyl-phosphate GlcNAc-1-phosphate transferase